MPPSLPAIVKALRIQEKVKQVGFEWEKKEDVWKKVEEEISELKEAEEQTEQGYIEEEFGDLLFSLVNYARFLKIDPETALEKTNKKFINRFQQMEQLAETNEKRLSEMNPDELDVLWNNVKQKNKNT